MTQSVYRKELLTGVIFAFLLINDGKVSLDKMKVKVHLAAFLSLCTYQLNTTSASIGLQNACQYVFLTNKYFCIINTFCLLHADKHLLTVSDCYVMMLC